MSGAVLEEHLRLCSERTKTYTNEQNIKFNTAVVAALQEMAALKTDKSDTDAALSFFTASGLYVDADGDIAQREQTEETEEEV